MSYNIIGIPQRESRPDIKREKLIKQLITKGLDPSLLPLTPATLCCLGRIGGGKSSIMYSFLKNMFPNYYDEVIIFCSSQDSKEAFEKLPQKNILFCEDYNDNHFGEYIDQLKSDQMEKLQKGETPLNIFIGFDDIVFKNSISNKSKPTNVERALLTCRHELNATMFICCQHSKQISPAIRNNIMYYCILPLQANDIKKVAEEHSNHLSNDDFIELYNEVMKTKHNFLLIDYKAPIERRFRINFDTIIE